MEKEDHLDKNNSGDTKLTKGIKKHKQGPLSAAMDQNIGLEAHLDS